MARFVQALILVILFCGCVTAETPESIKKLNPTGFYNNFSKRFPDLISQEQATSLETELKNFSKTSYGEIAVAVVDSFDRMDENVFATELFNHWQIGKKGKDNGVLIVIKPTKNGPGRRIYISTGYGAEGLVPDYQAKATIEEIMVPRFKENKYYEGIYLAIDRIQYLLSEGEIKSQNDEYFKAFDTLDEHHRTKYSSKSKKTSNLEILKIVAIIFLVISQVAFLINMLLALLFRLAMGKEDFIEEYGGLPEWHLFYMFTAGGSSSGGVRFGSGGGGFGGFGGGSSGGGGAGGGW